MILKRLFQWWKQRQRLESLLPPSVTSGRRAKVEQFIAKQLVGEEYYAMEFEGVRR